MLVRVRLHCCVFVYVLVFVCFFVYVLGVVCMSNFACVSISMIVDALVCMFVCR